MKEIKLGKSTGMGLLKESELVKVLTKTLEYTYSLQGSLLVEFIYNVEQNSLSIHFIKNGKLDYWFLFQADKLKKVKLKKLKESLNVQFAN